MIGAGLHGCFRLFKRGFFRVDEYGGLCYPGRVRGRSRGWVDGLVCARFPSIFLPVFDERCDWRPWREVIGCLARFSGGIKYINNVSTIPLFFPNAFDKTIKITKITFDWIIIYIYIANVTFFSTTRERGCWKEARRFLPA